MGKSGKQKLYHCEEVQEGEKFFTFNPIRAESMDIPWQIFLRYHHKYQLIGFKLLI